MKKHFFLFAVLASVAANAQVTHVELTGANYTNKTVTFRVWWNAGSRDATHLSKVWVWVDYIKINSNNTTSGNSWTRAAVSTVSSDATSYDGSNRKGFWLEGNSSTNYSATLTVQLNITETKFNWCAYASDYPPNMVLDGQTYYFKGTLPFILKDANGTAYEITQKSMPKANLTFVPVSITDKTECPGGLKEVIGTCPYTGSDWYADPNHKCQQRASGAKNWEAWIKDTRDSKLYRIVYMPDNKWWLAQNVKYAGTGYVFSGCTEDECGRAYTWAQTYASYAGGTSGSTGNVQGVCPSGWLLPVRATFSTLATSISSNASTACANLRSLDSNCSPRTNSYGYASQRGTTNSQPYQLSTHWYTNDEGREDGFGIDYYGGTECNKYNVDNKGDSGSIGAVRCYRVL
jgi:uncharacterized protein (TIGR02145 family)